MKRNIIITCFATLIFGLVALQPVSRPFRSMAVPLALAQDNPFVRSRVRQCSSGTLKGAYGVLLYGINIFSPVIPPGPFAGILLINFDGRGNYTAQLDANLSGVQTPTFPGAVTYSINPDCTGIFHGPEGYDYNMVMTNEGEEFHMMMDVAPNPDAPTGGLVAGGIGKRIETNIDGDGILDRARSFQCSPGVLNGSYAFTVSGSVLNMPGIATGPFYAMGAMRSNGNGRLIASGLISENGVVSQMQEEYTLTINSNCAGTITGPSNYRFIAVHGGKELLLLQTYPEGVNFPPGSGAVRYGLAQK